MHQDILSYLHHASENKTLAHGYALIGPENSGKMELLGLFLKDFFPADSMAHPDIKIIGPEEDVITIGTVREARSWLSLTPLAADKKALIINQAHTLNTEAQNAFLKILEEPSDSTYIFLLLNHAKRILPTVYSRVVALHVAPEREDRPATGPEHLIHSLLAADSAPARMRLWLSAGIVQGDIRSWLQEALPKLRSRLSGTRSKSLARAMRDLIRALAYPKARNWQLVAERLIISL
ncbi:MAG: hypothetical protein HYT31_02615 [Parcubacteria group bacterium]|nr:hypothetical protein [Parcubacteria group bacterium]